MTPSQESGTEKSSVRSKSGRRKARRRHRNRLPEVEARARLKVRQPDDLLALIPYLIGFHPDEDLVAVFIKSGRVKLTTRTDIPPESAGDELAEWIDALAKREHADALALIAYSAASLPANRLLTRLMDRLSEHELTDVLYVGHGRWWSLTCGEECCPLAGTLYDLSSHPMSAAAVLADQPAVDPSDGSAQRARADRCALRRTWPVVVADLWRGVLSPSRHTV
jgi:hypothetical protein